MLPPSERLRAAVRAQAFPERAHPAAAAAAAEIAALGAGSVAAVVFFGSRKTDAQPDADSAWDFFVVLSGGYGPFYRALRARDRLRRSPALLAGVSLALPPTQVSLRLGPAGEPLRAKCAVLTMRALQRETSPRRRDQFCSGRLFQPAEVAFAEPRAREAIFDSLVAAHLLTWEWGRAWLPPAFDVAGYCRRLLGVSYSGEIRPEPAARAEALWESQREALAPVYSVLLEDLAAAGELRALHRRRYELARPVSRAERFRARARLRLSLVRATARWAKHVVSFEGWLEYLLRKARRHSGQPIELTPRERRLPLLFLWPRVVRYLRRKDG